ncbi:hypothetical protein RND81_04G231000 [Saponaria officinalis]|uniref:ER membrane protein complex subunit 10 n=1 Tax=Saponaria officinalis TaxID=3572 RepID=A0AAW1LPW3_SAPOF
MKLPLSLLFLLTLSLLHHHSLAFQSDELDEDEFIVDGGADSSPAPEFDLRRSTTSPSPSMRRRRSSDMDVDSKLQFTLEHSFGDSEFSDAGTFSARLKTWSHGGQTLTKLRFSRNPLTSEEKQKFKVIIDEDDFYRIRLPSSVLSPPGRNYTVSVVKARCLPRGEALDEHFVIHMEGANILAVNYGSPGACPYPRLKKVPSKWSFNSHTVLKYSELAPRTPVFTEEAPLGETVEGVEGMPQPEKSFWAKYWMYLIPLGLIVMNAMTQAMNMPPEEQGAAPSGTAQQPARVAAGPPPRRR